MAIPGENGRTGEAIIRTEGENDRAAEAIIRTEGLTKVYAGTDFKAVDGLDLRIGPGEIFGLLGPNGDIQVALREWQCPCKC